MKRNELMQTKGLDVKELKDRAKTLKGEIGKLTMDKNMKKLKDLKQVSKKKKDLAQVLTVLRQKQMLEELTPKEVVVENFTKKNKSDKGDGTELSKNRR